MDKTFSGKEIRTIKSDFQELKDNINCAVSYIESWFQQTQQDIDSGVIISGEVQIQSIKRSLEYLLPIIKKAQQIAQSTQELK